MVASERKNIFFCIFGPTGAGKSTFCQNLLQDFDDMELSVSVTSRPPRPGEKEGIDYFFVSQEEFQERANKGEFFEWEETHGHLYGTLQSTINSVLEGTTDVLFDVDIRGALDFKKKFPIHAVNILILPQSLDVIKERLLDRFEVSEKELTRRLATVKMEYRTILDLLGKRESIDYVILNDDYATAYWTIQGIVYAERSRFARLEAEYVKKILSH